MQRVCALVVLVIAAGFAIVACSGETEALYESSHVADANTYQWAELADEYSSFPSSSFLEEFTSSESDVSSAEVVQMEEMEDYSSELMELRAAFNIDSIIEGRQHDDAEHDAALLEMEISSALSAEASPADFFRFARSHSRLYATEKAAAAAFAAFKQNKKAAAELNAALGITSASEAMFAATGPMSAISPAAFKSKILVAKNPRGRSRGKKVRITKGVATSKPKAAKTAKPSAAKPAAAKPPAKPAAKPTTKPAAKPATANPATATGKSRSVKPKAASGALQPQAGGGHTAGSAGGTGGMSGKTGGQSGKTGGMSGKTGGQSGKTGGQSGKTGGQSGKTGGQSGKTGGQSGKTGGQSGKTGGKSGKQGGKSGKQGGKSGKSGGGGVVFSSVANGTVQAKGSSVLSTLGMQGTEQYTNPEAAAKLGLSAASLRQLSRGYGIGDQAYNEAMATLKRTISIQRPMQADAQGRVFPQIPIQSNDCGSCWAIAAQQSLQRYWSAAAFPGVLSIQQLLDCIRTADSHGCRGGTPMDVFEFLATNIAANQVDYPDVMKDQACKKPPYPHTKLAYPSAGWEMLIPECVGGKDDPDCHGQVKYEMMVLGFTRQAGFQPPIAYVDASGWQNYIGGVFPPSLCKSTMEAGNHVVQIVGSGIDNLGIPFWLIDNFWGESWGEAGRIRLPFGVNACGLFNFALYATPPPFAKTSDPSNIAGIPMPGAKQAEYVPTPIHLQKVDRSSSHILDLTISRLNVGAAAPPLPPPPTPAPKA